MWWSVPHTLWSSEVDSWWAADHNKLELDTKTRWIRLVVPHYAIEISCRDFYDAAWAAIENLHIKITNEYKIGVESEFIFLNSCFKTRWVVEGELYRVHRQKQLLLPLCNGNSMLSRPINVTLYDKASLMCKSTPPPCLFLSNLRRQLLEIV